MIHFVLIWKINFRLILLKENYLSFQIKLIHLYNITIYIYSLLQYKIKMIKLFYNKTKQNKINFLLHFNKQNIYLQIVSAIFPVWYWVP